MVPCSLIVKLAQTFDCEIEIVKNGKTANAKAIFDLLGLMAEHNTTLLIVANGKMADVAVQQLTKLFSDNFRIN
jgi:phosphotransferase system HPr (HPr) family protein